MCLIGVTSCCPPREPQAPLPPTIVMIIVPAAAPSPAPPRPIPAVSNVALPDVKSETAHEQGSSLGRDSLEDQRPVAPAEPKSEIAPPARETLEPPRPEQPRVTLPEEVILQLLQTGKPLFLRCLKKAAAKDPSTSSLKVRLHVELDEAAKVTASKADTSDPDLASCLDRAVHWLTFPVTGKLVAIELPLFYRVE